MNKEQYIFSQLVKLLPYKEFYDIVRKHNGDKRIRTFTCWNQLLKMIFGQLANCDSLRDLCILTDAHHQKSYHLGFGKNTDRTTLLRANANRDYRIFEDFANLMIQKAQKCRVNINFDIDVEGNVYAFDSSIISLCLSVFWWATYNRQKGGIKLHTLYDVRTQIPDFVMVTPASIPDVIAMDFINYQAGSYYVFDRGYKDFYRLYNINIHNAFFVFRAYDQLRFKCIYSIENEHNSGIKSDQIGVFTNRSSAKRYPSRVRKINYYNAEQDRDFIFLTNDFTSSASVIAELYRKRWSIELFFKWIKQHLKIKTFWGTTANAVKIQVNCAIIAYCLVAIVAKNLKTERTIYELLQIFGKSLLDKTPIKQLLTKNYYNDFNKLNHKSLFNI